MTRSQRRRSDGQYYNVNPCNFGFVVNRWRYLVFRKGKVMQTVTDIQEMMESLISNKKGYRISVDGTIIEQPFDGETYDI